MKHSIDAQIEEVEHELTQRRNVYARIATTKPSQKSVLDMHDDRMRAVLGTLRWVKDHQVQLREVGRVAEDEGAA
jgi:hypothetical protein